MHSSCQKCNDSGSVLVKDRPVSIGGTVIDIGQRIECECSERRREVERNAKRRALYESAGVPQRYQAARLADCNDATQAKIMAWVSQPSGWIYAWGDMGTGKTHLAAAIVRETCRQLWTTLWVSASDAANLIAGRDGEKELQRLRHCAVLVVDDIGLRAPTAMQAENLFRLLDYRYGNDKPTVLTGNPSIDQLRAVPGFDRIADRMREQCKEMTFNGKTYRRGA